jgi:hypothetical protein
MCWVFGKLNVTVFVEVETDGTVEVVEVVSKVKAGPLAPLTVVVAPPPPVAVTVIAAEVVEVDAVQPEAQVTE